VLVAGVLTVGASACVLVSAAHLSAPWFAMALLPLGYRWNMSIVAGSAPLVRDVPPTEQLRVTAASKHGFGMRAISLSARASRSRHRRARAGN
jgi:hypothetical protein